MSTAPTPNALRPATKFMDELRYHAWASYQGVFVDTPDLRRAEDEIVRLAEPTIDAAGVVTESWTEAVVRWNCVEGFVLLAVSARGLTAKVMQGANRPLVGQPLFHAEKNKPKPDLNPLAALEISTSPEFPFNNCVLVFQNLPVFFKDVGVAQRWQLATTNRDFLWSRNETDLAHGAFPATCVELERFPILLGNRQTLTDAMRDTVTTIQYRLPDIGYMRKMLIDNQRTLDRNAGIHMPDGESSLPAERVDTLARALLGLTANQAEDAAAICLIQHGTFLSEEAQHTLEHQKGVILNDTSGLRYVPRERIGGEETVGGFTEFKHWMRRFRHCFHPQAEEWRLDKPKGAVLIGPPGTGKSLVGMISARMLNMPLVELDVGALFGSLVGESESRMRAAIQTIEAMKGVVVLIDEADKLWGGAAESSGDSGVTRRVFGKFLSWLASKEDGSFVIMTMNRTVGLPPEFLRRGRFDEIWFTDLPGPDERRTILEIHLRRRGLDPAQVIVDDAEWRRLLDDTHNFVGAELEACVIQARLNALESRNTHIPNCEELIYAANKTIPVAVLDKANVDAIREFCQGKARAVESVVTVTDLPSAPSGARRIRTAPSR